jgi:superfamily II DNA or RNA helicase
LDIRNTEKLNSNILRFFGSKDHFKATTGFLATRNVQLYDHQVEALSQIRRDRELGKRVSLIVFPTASGKSKIIEEDVLSLLVNDSSLRICIVAPSIAVVDDWTSRMLGVVERSGLKIRVGRSLDDQIIVSTYHLLWTSTYTADPSIFDYLVIDEAHHVTAPLLKRALKYFTPTYLMGLTATPKEDKEGEHFKEIFGEYEVQLTIEEAMDRGVISPARAFRIETNLDLSEVRFNGRNYINADLEKVIRVQSRNELIADVILDHFCGPGFDSMQGIVFCTSIDHANEMARIMNSYGISTLAAHSRIDNDAIQKFRDAKVRFLTTCSMISEGWDCPQIGIVVMARPTLSKILYLQQLGRGFRRHPGKESLYVIDVVDQYGSLAIPWSMNSIFNNPYYVPFGDPRTHYKPGDIITINGIKEVVLAIKEINTQTFENLYGDMLSAEQAARSLFLSTGTLTTWVRNNKAIPDLVVPFGRSNLYFFKPETVELIRVKNDLGVHNDDTILDDFMSFIKEYDFVFTFKIIFLLALLKTVDRNGEASIDCVREIYIHFYLERIRLGLQVDRDGCVYTSEYLMNGKRITTSILTNPFEKFERKRFVFYNKDLSKISFNSSLWSKLSNSDLLATQEIMFQHLLKYYSDKGGLQEVVYLRRDYEL